MTHLVKESIMQSADQTEMLPIKHSIDQPAIQSIKQTSKQEIRQATTLQQSNKLATKQSNNRSIIHFAIKQINNQPSR